MDDLKGTSESVAALKEQYGLGTRDAYALYQSQKEISPEHLSRVAQSFGLNGMLYAKDQNLRLYFCLTSLIGSVLEITGLGERGEDISGVLEYLPTARELAQEVHPSSTLFENIAQMMAPITETPEIGTLTSLMTVYASTAVKRYLAKTVAKEISLQEIISSIGRVLRDPERKDEFLFYIEDTLGTPLRKLVPEQSIQFGITYRREKDDGTLDDERTQKMMMVAYASARMIGSTEQMVNILDGDIREMDGCLRSAVKLADDVERVNAPPPMIDESKNRIARYADTMSAYQYILTQTHRHEGWLRNFLSR